MDSPRNAYLTSQLGLKFDPFTAWIAEHELKVEQRLDLSNESSRFFAYFSQPHLKTEKGGDLSLKDLRQRQHTIIYGEEGTGKTTFRINLDADCRTTLDQTFTVHYVLGQDFDQPLSDQKHGEQLAYAMGRDVFVQILEQYLAGQPVSDQKLKALRELYELGGEDLTRLVKRILKEPQPKGYAGMADHWRIVGRIPVRFTAASKSLLTILQKIQIHEPVLNPSLEGWEKVWATRAAARLWGVEAVLVLVDGVDAVRRDSPTMMAYLTSLLEKLSLLAEKEIYIKFFLPVELAPIIDAWFTTHQPSLPFSIQKARIMWTEQALKNMIQQRLSAAGGRYNGFDELAQGRLNHKLDDRIVSEAKGSPRQALMLVSNLINAHVATQPGRIKLDETDWAAMREMGSAQLENSV